jgi:endonuclease/exonuclease/phosphatase family metal-dependent hydrolase
VGFGWDAACRRVVTWGHFQELSTGKKFYVFNTHFDHLGKIARRESAKLVLSKIKEIAKNEPVILLGDFNATPDDEPIQLLVDSKNPDRLINSELISQNGHYGPIGSFNGFKSEKENSHIDYIFIKNGVKCLQHATHSETWNNRYPSDHFPVSASLILP